MSFCTLGCVSAALAVALGGTAYSQSAVQWRVEDGGNGHWYQVAVVDQPLTWSAANAVATAVGSHLLSVTSAAENSFARDLSVATPGAVRNAGGTTVGPWIGAHRHPTTGEFIWTSGETWSYAAWCGGEPTGPNWEDAVCYYAASLCWNDRPGDYVGVTACLSAVLEWSADCNADGIVDYGQCRDGSLPDYDGDNVPDCCKAGTPCTVGNYPIQWRVEDGGNGHWYQQSLYGLFESWNVAAQSSVEHGGYLTTITSASEQAFVHRNIRPGTCETHGGSVWIGGQQQPGMPPAAGWRWLTNEAWQYTNWSPGEPNDFDGWSEDIIAMYSVSGRWNDGTSNVPAAFACNFSALTEWSADCDTDGVVDYGQILRGEVADVNGNGIPDACDCPADINQSGTIDAEDLAYVLFAWGMTGGKAGDADINGDAIVDANDLSLALGSWGICPQ